MNRVDRLFAILLALRSGQAVSASDLARRFEVSRRTIYRDLDALSESGVPVYAERGRAGGVRLMEGYFLPPLMFARGEAVGLLLGLTLLQSVRATPFLSELETARRKLLAALPDRLRAVLSRMERVVGFERPPGDIFHPEPPSPARGAGFSPGSLSEGDMVTVFLEAILYGTTVHITYHSPYRGEADECTARPLGLFWDRDRWYLAGMRDGASGRLRMWRSDRIVGIRSDYPVEDEATEFDVRELLGRNWLKEAMEQWRQQAPVRIRLTREQAERLQHDWYYRHANFEATSEHEVMMTIGEDDSAVVLPLLRWLGPGAELVEPVSWRARMRAELDEMLAQYDERDV